jgi:hypothetical protein
MLSDLTRDFPKLAASLAQHERRASMAESEARLIDALIALRKQSDALSEKTRAVEGARHECLTVRSSESLVAQALVSLLELDGRLTSPIAVERVTKWR